MPGGRESRKQEVKMVINIYLNAACLTISHDNFFKGGPFLHLKVTIS